jgi:hypothetical protein
MICEKLKFSSRFRRLYLRYLKQAYVAGNLRFYGQLQHLSRPASFASYLAPLRKTKWVVYAKPPFGRPERVLDYLGRYTHRVAISNHRLQQLQDGRVTFAYKDYKDQQQPKLMTLSADEFLRRFCCMYYRRASSGFATMVFSATGTVPKT